jgi:23S rRNA (adenine2030-N6)-methyltransferase
VNYRHLYHAGNFADVFKHIILVALIQSLLRKESPYCYLDTHAGAGYYDLNTKLIKGRKEYNDGVGKVIHGHSMPPLVKNYVDCIWQVNHRLTQSTTTSLRYYPGSSYIVRCFARQQDRIIACELHPQTHQALHQAFVHDKQVQVQQMDGYLGLKSFLPPRERRGVVLIDPPYEHVDEFTKIIDLLPVALKRWQTGIYAIWYPIKERTRITRFQQLLKNNVSRFTLVAEFSIYPEDIPTVLNGSGVAIINPPWQFKETLAIILPWLWQILSINKQGGYRIYSLTNS